MITYDFWQWWGGRNIGRGEMDSCDRVLAMRSWQAAIERCLPYMQHKSGCKRLIAPIPDGILEYGGENLDEPCTCGLEKIRNEKI